MINLLGYKVTAIAREGNYLEFKLVNSETSQVTCCPFCQSLNNTHRFGAKEVSYVDIPLRKKRIKLRISRKRFICKSCDKTFYEPLKHIHEKRQLTERVCQYIRLLSHNSKKDPVGIAKEIGISEATVRKVLGEKRHLHLQ